MRVLVVGYGSIGQRHCRILAAAGHEVAIASSREIGVAPCYGSLGYALDNFNPDYVVVSNATSNHLSSVQDLVEHRFEGAVLCEKPLFHAPSAPPRLRFRRAGVGYNLRFHPGIGVVREALAVQDVFSAHAYVGQYLPDWRPSIDYRESASAKSVASGGVLRDLSHELDLLTWMLGPWSSLTALGGRFSDLEIETDDSFSVLFMSARCPAVTVHLNYLDRQPRRQMSFQTPGGTIAVDLIAGTIRTPAGGEVRIDVGRDDTYVDMHRAMLGDEPDERTCSIEEGLGVVEMIDAAERAARERVWVAR